MPKAQPPKNQRTDSAVLFVSPQSVPAELKREAAKAKRSILRAGGCHAAREALHENPSISHVLTETSFDDGNWCDVLRHVVESGTQPERVEVFSRETSPRFEYEVQCRGASVTSRLQLH